jgi:dienelactone hydrolase
VSTALTTENNPTGELHMPVVPRSLLFVLSMPLVAISLSAQAQPPAVRAPETYRPSDEELAPVRTQLAALGDRLKELRAKQHQDALADVAIFHKAAEWVVRLGEFRGKDDVAKTLRVLALGEERARLLADGKRPWTEAKGTSIRGYVSKIDGSIQPLAISVPAKAPDSGRFRLDVVLHGRDESLTEVRFITAHQGKAASADEPGLVLHVFGRTNNAYRWAGETDVFEAIETVKRQYPVDERRVVLRGFSMGGAGAWHLGLHYPREWCAVEAGAGFSDTKKYLNTDAMFTAVQEKGLHIYDAVDYSLNAYNVPIAGYGGELDKQLQASTNIKLALEALGVPMKTEGLVTRAEGVDFLQVIGAKTGHSVDPESAKLLKSFRDEHATSGISLEPIPIRFVTYTLKYNRAPWLSVERLVNHYERATVDAKVLPGEVVEVKTANVAILGVDRDAGETIRLGMKEFPLRQAVKGLLPEVYFRLLDADRWELMDYDQSRAMQDNTKAAKRPGLQGPIDDAFTGPFLCVRGTGRPWNAQADAWANDRLNGFAALWDKSLRGTLRIKSDTEVTADDLERFHLILFGDPGSNVVIERLLPRLPLGWTRTEIKLGGTFTAINHIPVLIAPNPLNPLRYVVLNSGHTFGSDAFAGTNALLYPRLGDFAVFALGASSSEPKISGFFDENWKPRP